MAPDPRPSQYRPVIVAGILLTLVVVLATAGTVLIPIALGILLSFALNPPVAYLQARGLSRPVAVGVVVALTTLVLGLMLTSLLIQLRDLVTELPERKEQISQKVRDLVGHSHQHSLFGRFNNMIQEISVEIQGKHRSENKPPALTIPVRIETDAATNFGFLSLLAGPLSKFFAAIGLTIGLTVSMLLTREDLRNRLFLLLGDSEMTRTNRALDDVSKRISRYLLTQVVLNLSFGLIYGVILWLIGVKYAYSWGVLAACLRFVPYIGTWLAAFFPVLISLEADGWEQMIAVGIATVVLGLAFNSLLEPRLVSRSTGVTPIALVVSMAFWTWLWGPIGLILATPMTVCLYVLGKHVPSLYFLDVILGDDAALDPCVRISHSLLTHQEVEAADLFEKELQQLGPERWFATIVRPVFQRLRSDLEHGKLSKDEFCVLVQMLHEIGNSIFVESMSGVEREGALVFCCPTHDALDRVALEWFDRVFIGNSARMEMIRNEVTVAETLARVQQESPCLVFIAGFPPTGSSHTRYLCKRLRKMFPHLPILVAFWEPEETNPILLQQLKEAGASHVAFSFTEALSHLNPIVQLAAHLSSKESPSADVQISDS